MTKTSKKDDEQFALQEASAANPEIAANMGRHMAALNLVLLGRRGHDAPPREVLIQAGFRMTIGERDLIMAAAARLETDIVHLAFQVENADGAPHGIAVFRIEGEEIACYPRCSLWAPVGSGKMLIVGLDENAPCHFVARPGEPLAKVEGWPAKKIEAGMRRAVGRFLKLAASDDLRDAHVGARHSVIGWEGPGRWTYRGNLLAA